MAGENIARIPVWTGSLLANAEFLGFSQEVAVKVRGLDDAAFHVAAARARLEEINARLVDFIAEVRTFDETAALATLDARRDALFGAFWAAVRFLAKLRGDSPLDRAARTLAVAISPYKGITRHSLVREAAELQALKFDLEKSPAVTAAVGTLGLGAIVAELFAANAAFDEMHAARNTSATERMSERAGETTAGLRREAAGLVAGIFEKINAANLLNATAAGAEAAALLCGLVAQYKTVAALHRRKRRRDPSREMPDPSGVPPA